MRRKVSGLNYESTEIRSGIHCWHVLSCRLLKQTSHPTPDTFLSNVFQVTENITQLQRYFVGLPLEVP